MKKIFIAMAAIVCSMSVNAQTMKVMKGDEVVAIYTADQADKVVFEEATAPATDANLLPGEFTVAEGKTVKFTKSNLYWDGSAFKFEANQTDYQTSWDANHVSHFYWTKTEAASYATSYDDGTKSTSDVPFFAESKGGLTVEGTEGLYALSGAEWTYLIQTRANAGNLCKCGVTVVGEANCLIIAPDGFIGSIASSYTAEEWTAAEALGLVCLPAAGNRTDSSFNNGVNGVCYGGYWSATLFSGFSDFAYYLYFTLSDGVETCSSFRSLARGLRLVK